MADEDLREERETEPVVEDTSSWQAVGGLIVAAVLFAAIFATFLLPPDLQRTASNSGSPPATQTAPNAQ